MTQYKYAYLFEFFENKLHVMDWLDHRQIPFIKPLYGAFAYKRHAVLSRLFSGFTWLEFNQHMKTPYILKPATDGMRRNIAIVYSNDSVTNSKMLTFAGDVLYDERRAEWGQRSPHYGILMAPFVSTGTLPLYQSKAVEIFSYVVYGRIGTVQMHNVPYDANEYVKMYLGANIHETIHCDPWNCKWALNLMYKLQHQLNEIGRKVACAWGADWFRLDAFWIEDKLYVSELTYPGHIPPDGRDLLHLNKHKKRLVGQCVQVSAFVHAMGKKISVVNALHNDPYIGNRNRWQQSVYDNTW